MKKITFFSLVKLLFTVVCVFAFHSTTAQSGVYLTWNNQVGCISYDSEGNPNEPRKALVFDEEIENAPCIRVCEGSIVDYVMNGPNITNVQWSASGGTITYIGGAANKNATISWGGPGNGALNLTIFYANGTQSEVTLCIEKINSPKAIADIYGTDTTEFCMDTPINFQNLSINNGGSEIVYYYWNFGDGEVSYAFEPTHSYTHSGNYTVTLTVTNNCNCSNTYSFDVKIVDRPNVVINCPSTVCEDGKVQSYSVNDCGGSWLVEGGTIVNQTATTVDVIWDQVDALGFGYVSYLSECTCPFWTTIKIPVVKQTGTIQGEPTLCVGEQGLYTLPQWPTTNFVWTLSPSNGGGQLIFTDQRNQVYVEGISPGIYDLVCNYTNTLLGCSGSAAIRITVVEGTVIVSNQSDEFCSSNTPKTYTTTSGAIVDWELTKNNAVVATSTSATFSYSFLQGGVYTLTATTGGGCSGEPKVITVTQTPSTPTGSITGESNICIGVPYEYSYNNTVSNTTLVWEIVPSSAGTIQGDNTGNNVTIIFNAAATVKIKRVGLDGLGCTSGYLSKTVTPVVINPVITSSSTIFCPSSQSTFTVNLNGLTPDLIEWSFPNAAFGNIINGINSTTVTVSWNEISNTAQDVLRLRVKKCNIDMNFDTTINLYQAPTLTLSTDPEICYGSPLVLTLSAPGVTSGTVDWDFGNGVTNTTAYSPSGTYTFSNPYNNNTGSNINQTITATLNSPNGCNYSPTTTTSIIVFPRTVISISPGYNYLVCPSDYDPFTLNANAITGIGMSVTYQWFKNGLNTGITGSTYTVSGSTPQGTYYVKVTDSNGCTVNSQNIVVTADCGDPVPCVITPAPNLTVSATWSTCGTIVANASYAGTPTTVQWIGSPLISLQSSTNSTATFTSNTPGSHLVTVKLTYQTASGPCVVQQTVEVDTNYKPDFNSIISCNSGGTGVSYNVTLVDNSTVFEPNGISYNFTGPGISSPTGQTVTLNNLAPGTYNYTFTVSMPGKPACTVTKTITLAPAANTDFTISNSNSCAEEPILLTITNYDPANTYEWFFLTTSYIASSATTAIQIDQPTDQYNISLGVTTPQGCYFENPGQLVNITKAVFDGAINVTPSNNECEGTTQTLTYVPSNVSITPSSYAWMLGNQQVGTSNTYIPTTSGVYWIKLFDSQNCTYTLTNPQTITIRQRPYAGIVGSSSVCSGDQGTVQGVVTNPNLERRWLLNGTAMTAPYGTWSTSTPLLINVPTTTGTYNYTFEVRPANDTGCGSSASLSVTVYAALTPPVLNYNVINCEPYVVQVTASGPSTGTYNWSNGDVGQTITVGSGGALGVTYTALSGCSVSSDIMIPQPLERSLWIFPEGCYDLCYNTLPAPYIIGPLGIFDFYQWLLNGNPMLSGTNTTIPQLPITQGGSYQLTIQNDGCNFESGTMSLVPNSESCEVVSCEFKSEVKEDTSYDGSVYWVDGYIQNNTGSPITVTITSFNNYGTYLPGIVTISPYSTYAFAPLQFVPNASFTGGNDIIVLQMPGCMTAYPVKFPEQGEQSTGRPAAMSIVPNPAVESTTVKYDLGDLYKAAESLTVYNLLGNPIYTTALDKPSGEVNLNTIALPSGSYIVSIQADGVKAIQKVLVKK